jgi:hypothetical protein
LEKPNPPAAAKDPGLIKNRSPYLERRGRGLSHP